APWSLVVLTLLLAAGAVTTVIIVGRPLTGIGGTPAAQRRVHYLALAAGLVGVFALEGALAHAGASNSLLGVYGATAPMLMSGVVYAASPAVWQDWSTRLLGRCLGDRRPAGWCRLPGGRGGPARPGSCMSDEELDPVIHAPARLRIV